VERRGQWTSHPDDQPGRKVGNVFCVRQDIAEREQPNAKVQPHAAPTQLFPAPQPGAACRLQRYVRRSCCTATACARCCLVVPPGAIAGGDVGVQPLTTAPAWFRAAVELSSTRMRDAARRRSPEGGVPLLWMRTPRGRMAAARRRCTFGGAGSRRSAAVRCAGHGIQQFVGRFLRCFRGAAVEACAAKALGRQSAVNRSGGGAVLLFSQLLAAPTWCADATANPGFPEPKSRCCKRLEAALDLCSRLHGRWRSLTPKFSRMRRPRNPAGAPNPGAACRLQRYVRRRTCRERESAEERRLGGLRTALAISYSTPQGAPDHARGVLRSRGGPRGSRRSQDHSAVSSRS
jgi:hypothetical protein